MPKVVSSHRRARSVLVQQRCDQRNHHYPQVTSCAASAWMTSPRKVSFEEGHQSNPSFSCSSQAGSSSSSTSLASCQGSLRRKAPSVCLADLARDQDGSSSPLPLPSSSSDDSCCASPSTSCPSSPWGHFVDILIPLEAEEQGDDMYRKQPSSCLPPNIPASLSRRGDVEGPYPTFQPRRRHRQQRCLTPSVEPHHPYGLQPRRRTRKGSFSSFKASSFLPGLVLDEEEESLQGGEEEDQTKQVEVALQRLKF